MNQYGIGDKSIWATEGNWGENTTLTANEQAAYLAQEYIHLWSKGVSRFYWYSWDNSSWGQLWTPSEGVNEAGIAYGELYRWLVGSVHPANPCSQTADGTRRCVLTLANGKPAEIIWNGFRTTPRTTSHVFTEYYTLVNDLPTSIKGNSVLIGSDPILLVSARF
jgi:hypothetical protein